MGGSSGGGAEVVNQGGLIDSPLNNFLIPQAQNMLQYAGTYSTLGSGFNLAPNQLMGQVYVPGPNQTIFGNPYNTQQQSSAYWGQAANPNYQQMYNSFLHPGQGGYNVGGYVNGNGAGGLGQSRVPTNQENQGQGNDAVQNPSQDLVGKLNQLSGQLQQIGGQQQQQPSAQLQQPTNQPTQLPVVEPNIGVIK